MLLLHVPFFIAEPLHLHMLAEKRKLCEELKDTCDFVITVDHCSIQADLSGFQVLDLTSSPATGIVRPTRAAIEYALKHHGPDCWLARLGQDVFLDRSAFKEFLKTLDGLPGDALVGGKCARANIVGLLESIGVKDAVETEEYVQGNFMCARVSTWIKFYNAMPDHITHMCDDSLMSALAQRRGGQLVFVTPFWEHYHGGTGGLYDLAHGYQHVLKCITSAYSDVKDLVPTFAELSKQCDSITEFRTWQGVSTIAWMAHCRKIRSYGTVPWPLGDAIKTYLPNTDFAFAVAHSLETAIEPTDLLFLDNMHTHDHVLRELTHHCDRVKKYIVVHDTSIYGKRGEDGRSPGLNAAIDAFLQSHREWRIHGVLEQSHGCTILRKANALPSQLFARKKLTGFLVLYRYHEGKRKDEQKREWLDIFLRQIRAQPLPFSLHLIIDNTDSAFEAELRDRFAKPEIIIHTTQSRTSTRLMPNQKVCTPRHHTLYCESMDLVSQHANDETIIMFCEDDYLYKNDAFSKLKLFLEQRPGDFATLYDHPDRYVENLRLGELAFAQKGPLTSEIIWLQHHWRTCISTCHTFACTLNALKLNDDLIFHPTRQRGDHDMWCNIWKRGSSKLWGAIPGLASHRRGPHLEKEWTPGVQHHTPI